MYQFKKSGLKGINIFKLRNNGRPIHRTGTQGHCPRRKCSILFPSGVIYITKTTGNWQILPDHATTFFAHTYTFKFPIPFVDGVRVGKGGIMSIKQKTAVEEIR